MMKIDYSQQGQQLQAILQDKAEELGQEMGLVQRESKLGAMQLVVTVVLGWLHNPSASLNQLAQLSGRLGVEISAAGIHQRIGMAAVAVLQGLLRYSLGLLISPYRLSGTVLSQFNGVMVVDSTVISLPAHLARLWAEVGGDGSPAAVRLQLGLDVLSGNLEAIESEDGRRVDQQSTLIVRLIRRGRLLLFDLGYFNQDTLAAIDTGGAYFVCRYKFRTALYQPNTPDQSINLLNYLSGTVGIHPHTLAVLVGRRQRLPLRLIAQRLPKSVAAERRRKAKRKAKHDGQTLSAAYLALLDWSLYLTNTTPEQLTDTQVITTYRMRWQVELVFKLWKSNAQLDHIRQWRTERVLAHLYARLLGLIIFHWLIAPVRAIYRLDLSFVKAFQVFQSHVFDWLTAIVHGWQSLTQHLDQFASDLRRFACKDKRRKQPSTWQQLACQPLA
jgi:hypothetical protein